ncbi:collagen alpha-1(III) chain-like [Rissa tridactyla]|uniref:collagen alpha-1(III) chain-like n=1 Tax=Rissa tridactyla TaxID=75485 RepID=UPI0023BB05A5|nr:collagen alpha-1(III) chain-like [Rissa tridactyla]
MQDHKHTLGQAQRPSGRTDPQGEEAEATEDTEQTPCPLHNQLYETMAHAEPPGFPGVPGQGGGTAGCWATGMQVTGELVPGRQGCHKPLQQLARGGAGWCRRTGRAVSQGGPGCRRCGMGFTQVPVCCCWTWASPARPTDQPHPCCTEGETEAGRAAGASGGQSAQPRPCTNPPGLQKDHSLASTRSVSAPRDPRSQPCMAHHAPRRSPALRGDAVPPSPCAPRPQEPPLTTKDGAGGSGQRHRRKQELACGWEGTQHPGPPRPWPPRHARTPAQGPCLLPGTRPRHPPLLWRQEARVKLFV